VHAVRKCQLLKFKQNVGPRSAVSYSSNISKEILRVCGFGYAVLLSEMFWLSWWSVGGKGGGEKKLVG
jgi:hypothetical protein